jgi:hypothetical protein
MEHRLLFYCDEKEKYMQVACARIKAFIIFYE